MADAPIAYKEESTPELNELAAKMLLVGCGKFDVSVSGACPECGDALTEHRSPFKVASGVRRILATGDGLIGKIPISIEVEQTRTKRIPMQCTCSVKHGEDVKGCGRRWLIEVECPVVGVEE